MNKNSEKKQTSNKNGTHSIIPDKEFIVDENKKTKIETSKVIKDTTDNQENETDNKEKKTISLAKKLKKREKNRRNRLNKTNRRLAEKNNSNNADKENNIKKDKTSRKERRSKEFSKNYGKDNKKVKNTELQETSENANTNNDTKDSNDSKNTNNTSKISKTNTNNNTIITPVKENTDKLLNEPAKTIFLQNVNYTATEADLKAFFSKFGSVVYAKICKSNGVSKGTAFVMFEKKEDCESIVRTFKKSEENKEFELNPFEFEGKFLKIFQAYDKNDASQKPDKKEDRRNREFLLYGLYTNYNGELSDSDKEKREFIIKSKKENFKNNPNLYTSKTRLTIRNFAKNVEESELRKKILDACNEWINDIKDIEKRKYYERTKKIKQVKLIRDPNNNNKSKVSNQQL